MGEDDNGQTQVVEPACSGDSTMEGSDTGPGVDTGQASPGTDLGAVGSGDREGATGSGESVMEVVEVSDSGQIPVHSEPVTCSTFIQQKEEAKNKCGAVLMTGNVKLDACDTDTQRSGGGAEVNTCADTDTMDTEQDGK